MIARRVAPLFGSYVASPDYIRRFGAPQTGEELLAHQALMQGTESWQLVDGDQVVTIHPSGRFKADNGAALLAAALAGVGIAALPDPIVEDYVASGELIRVMTRHPPPPAGIYVVRPPGPLVPRKVQVLIDLLIECSDQEPPIIGRTR